MQKEATSIDAQRRFLPKEIAQRAQRLTEIELILAILYVWCVPGSATEKLFDMAQEPWLLKSATLRAKQVFINLR